MSANTKSTTSGVKREIPATDTKRNTLPTAADGKSLHFLYRTVPGRVLLKLLVSPTISRLVGTYMNSFFSRGMIKRWIKSNNIDMTQYEEGPFSCFNDFFARRIKESARQFDMAPSSLIAPCDSKLTAYPIDKGSAFSIKGSVYTVESLLQDKELAESYRDGLCLIFRLTVDDYHRYCYVDNGTKTDNVFIKGKLHTVQPIALERYNIYKENSREYTVLDTVNFGKVTQVEVGALLVGKIRNHHQTGSIKKGKEKGMFLFGGSTIVLLLEKGAACLDQEILDNTKQGLETIVKIGERIGTA